MKPIDPKRRLPHPRRKPARFPDRLGDFRLIRKLGGGAASEVYLAEQISLGRRVALKMIRPGSLFFSGAKERLLAEARAAARIRHPSLCPIFDAGESGGIPFLVMPYIEGETLAARIRKGHSPGDRRWRDTILSILAETARAIHAAHEAGLVHGDIKPSNILITPEERPVVLDFDMAGHEGSLPAPGTAYPGFRGTPDYMPPERLQPRPSPATRRGDVYSLGVTLYEALAGRKPFQGSTLERVRENILSRNFPRLRDLDPSISKDLSLVVATAMEENPENRYQDCLELARDLERVRQGEPVHARPLSAQERTRRWIRKNPFLSGVFLLLVAALVLSGLLLDTLKRANDRNQFLLRETQALALARASAQAFGKDQVLSLLLARKALEKAALFPTLTQIQAVLAGIRQRTSFPGGPGPVKEVFFSPSGRRLLTRSAWGRVCVWTPGGRLVGEPAPKKKFRKAFFLPPGNHVLTINWKGDPEEWTLSGRRVRTFPSLPGRDNKFLLSRKGRFLLAWSSGKPAHLVDLAANRKITLPGACPSPTFFAISPRENLLVRGDAAGGVRIIDTKGRILKAWKDPAFRVSAVSFARNGSRFLAASRDGRVRIWTPGGVLLSTSKCHERKIFSACFSPDARFLLTAGIDRTVRLRDLQRNKTWWILGGKPGLIAARFSPPGKKVLLAYCNRSIEIYDLRGRLRQEIQGHLSSILDAVFSPDGKFVATTSSDGTARLWSLLPGKYPLLDHSLPANRAGKDPPRVEGGCFLAPGNIVVTGASDGGLRFWNPRGKLLRVRFSRPISGLTAARGGNNLLVSCNRGLLLLVNRWGKTVRTIFLSRGKGRVGPAAFAPRGGTILAARVGGPPCLLNRKGRVIRVFPARSGVEPCVDFSPGGKLLLFTAKNREVQVWEPRGKRILLFSEKGSPLTFARFGPKGKRILAARQDGKVEIRDLRGRVLAVLQGHTRKVTWAEFSPDGREVATASQDTTARLWTAEGVPLQVLKGHKAPLTCARFSPSGDRLLTCSSDGTARIWEVRPEKILQYARRVCPRDLSAADKREYGHILGD